MSFEEYLSANTPRVDAYVDLYFPHGCHPDMDRYLYDFLHVYSANGGKRHRPLICELACVAVGGTREMAQTAAAAIEHFHTAALIHDDIADDSKLRRGEPCLHLTQGEGLAINAGDLALSLLTGAVIFDPTYSSDMKVRVLQELVDMSARTIEGQALDIGWARDNRFDLTVEDYVTMATHKTAFYSGATPLAVGAIVGGGSDGEVEALRAFGLATGLAFQIQDDLLNLVGSKEATQKDFRSDITEGKRTMATVYAIQHSPDSTELIEILGQHAADEALLARAVVIMEECGAIAFARDYAHTLIMNAKSALAAALPPSDARDLLLAMADFFIARMN